MVHRNILKNIGNLSKEFMCLNLGVIPVKFVIMEKKKKFFLLNTYMMKALFL